jgi:DNA adenine methylase
MLDVLEVSLDPILKNADQFHDVFVGGGSVLCHVAKRYRNLALYVNDADKWISSFWSCLTDRVQLDALIDRLKERPTVELFQKLREVEPADVVGQAYHAVFFNRTTFSGILESGPIGGYKNQATATWKIDCRYNFKLLQKDLEEMYSLFQGRLTVANEDFSTYLARIGDVPCYLDPPYFEKGHELYRKFMQTPEHEALAEFLRDKHHWVLSYDSAEEIEKLYRDFFKLDLSTRYSITGSTRNSWVRKGEFVFLSYTPTKSGKQLMLDLAEKHRNKKSAAKGQLPLFDPNA